MMCVFFTNRPLLVMGWLVGVLASSHVASCQPAPPKALSLRTDKRLQRTVKLKEFGISLKELLSKLSSSELRLTVDRSCAEQKVQVSLEDRPLHLLMSALAQLLPGFWEPLDDNAGFRFSLSVKAVRAKENWWQLYTTEREKALKAQQALWVQKMQEPSENGEPSLYALLPATLQQQIARQMVDTGFYRAEVYSMGRIPHEGGVVVRLQELPLEAQQRIRRAVSGPLPSQPLIHFANTGISLDPSLITSSPPWPSVAMPLSLGKGGPTSMAGMDHSWLLFMTEKYGVRWPPDWKPLLDYQQKRVWKNDPSSLKPERYPPYHRAAVLDWLAEKAGIEFVADYYSQNSTPFPPSQRKLPLRHSLKEELDFAAVTYDMSWKQRSDQIYLFRNNRWYRDDALEVSDVLVQQWLPSIKTLTRANLLRDKETPATKQERHRQTLNLKAELVTQLTPYQLFNGLLYAVPRQEVLTFVPNKTPYGWQPFGAIVEKILPEYNTIRFYVSLSHERRSKLLEGKLPYASLTNTQQRQVLFLLPEMYALLEQPPHPPVLLGIEHTYPVTFTAVGEVDAYSIQEAMSTPETTLVITSPSK